MSTGTVFRVANPWAWSWLPPAFIPVTTDPDQTDGLHCYPDRPAWPIVVDTVIAAVRQAQQLLTCTLSREVEVVIDTELDSASFRVIESWLAPGGAEGVWWFPSEQTGKPRIGDGRHRLYSARTSRHHDRGMFTRMQALPLQVEPLLYLRDAVLDYGDEKLRRRMACGLGQESLPELASWIRGSWRLRRHNQLLLANIDRAIAIVNLGWAIMTDVEHRTLNP